MPNGLRLIEFICILYALSNTITLEFRFFRHEMTPHIFSIQQLFVYSNLLNHTSFVQVMNKLESNQTII